MKQLAQWLGPARMRVLVGLLAVAGVGAVLLQLAFPDEDWTLSAQLALVWVMFAGLAVLLGAKVPPEQRGRWRLMFGPGLVLVGLGVLIPDWALFFAGGGLGWMVAAQMVLRGRVQMEYQQAIRHLRHSEYEEAIAAMQPLIKAEPKDANHRRFRAELYRLSGDLNKAISDYKQVIRLAPDAAMGYTGLAEVYAQQGRFDEAYNYALQAYEREPYQWMTAYNLGLIADRTANPAEAVKYLETALASGVPHSRYRVLTHLWLARNYHRQGDDAKARDHLRSLRKQERGLKEWRVVFESEQAAPLRRMLAADVDLVQQIVTGVVEETGQIAILDS